MRLTTIAASAAALALTVGGAAVAVADPGPHHGNNSYGLCTAYEARNSNGKEDKDNSQKPFAALEAAAANEDGETPYDRVMAWCSTQGTHPGGKDDSDDGEE